MLRVFKPPFNEMIPIKIFLAGTIDMGNSIDWQQKLTDTLRESISDYNELLGGAPDIHIFNPRRDDWDSTWEQTVENEMFNEQVTWELQNIEDSDLVAINFLPDSKSPITLLELGLLAGGSPEKVIVCCPKEFYRRGNVEIVCSRYNIPIFDNEKDFIKHIEQMIDAGVRSRISLSETKLTPNPEDKDELK